MVVFVYPHGAALHALLRTFCKKSVEKRKQRQMRRAARGISPMIFDIIASSKENTMKHDIFCIVVGILIALTGGGGYLLGRNCAVQSAEQAKSQAQEEFRLRYGFGDVLLVMRDTPAGTVLTKNMLGYKTVPMTGLSGRGFHEEDLDEVLGRTLAFDLKRGDAILKTDLLPKQ